MFDHRDRLSLRVLRRARRVMGALAALGGLTGCVIAPPPVYGTATQPVAVPSGTAEAIPYGATCYAGFYTCALPNSLPIGSGCSCPGLGAPSYGTVR